MFSSVARTVIPTLLVCFVVACSDDESSSSGGTPTTSSSSGSSGMSSGSSGSSGASSSGSSGQTDPKDIVDTAVAAKFTFLAAAVTRAGLVETLKGPGPFTVLAPTDDAFKKTPFDSIEKINAADPAALGQILKLHVISGKAQAADVTKLTSAETLAAGSGDGKIRIRIAVSGANVTIFPTKDLSAGPSAGADPGAKVSQTDVQAKNGVIHVLDSVLIPPSKDIVGAASSYPTLSTLTSVVASNPGGGAPSLAETLQSKGPFTVFAPTNDAFTGAQGIIAGLTPEQVRTVVLFHALPSFATSGDVANANAQTALATAAPGKSLGVVPGSPPKIKDSTDTNANLAATDVITKNGIVHVVDKVLVPQL